MTSTPRSATALTDGLLSSLRTGGDSPFQTRFGKAHDVSVGFTEALRAFPDQTEASFATSDMAVSLAGGAASAASLNPGLSPLLLRAAANNRKIAATVEDPIAAKQWHLGYLGDLAKVWQDFDGTGVSFGVYDSGIDKRLDAWGDRYDASKEVVIDGKKYDGDYTPLSGPHGTSVAGLIAAGRDGDDTIGISYNAGITGVNIFDPYSGGGRKQGIYVNADYNAPFFEAVNQFGTFDVVNNSWGPGEASHGPNDNRLFEGSFAYGMTLAYQKAAAEGRGGLGTVVVNAAGNYGMVRNNTDLLYAVDGALDSASTDRHAIAVAAYRQTDGNAASYSTRGAHLLISAPSSDYAELGSAGIWTADLKGKEGYNTQDDPGGALDYTDSFGGTSAAAPILSGVVGLMLDANANLGWRDVKNILATSAVMPVDFDTGETAVEYQGTRYYLNEDRFHLTGDGSASRINGGGYHFSTDYGYGAVDAFSAVRMAEVWSLFGAAKTSANEKVYSGGGAFNRVLPDARYSGNSVATTPMVFNIGIGKNVDIEHLDLKFTYTNLPNGFDDFDYSASFRITVRSPDGTTYQTSLVGLGYAYGENDTLITEAIGLAGFRGETSGGNWTITFEDVTPGTVNVIKDMRLEFSGSEVTTNDVYHFTQEFATMAAIDGQSARRQIFDTNGGEDWIDMAAMTDNVDLNLSGGDIYLGENQYTGAIRLMNGSVENVVSGDGNDSLTGSARANKLYGMRGNDVINGMGGNDIISGGQGNDTMDGGRGADTFLFSLAENTGRDIIYNFDAEDRLSFDAKLADANNDGKIELQVFEKYGVASLLRLDNVLNGDRITFENRKISAIYFLGEKDGQFLYGTTAPAQQTFGFDASTQPAAHAEPALWYTGMEGAVPHHDSLFIA
ncbi:S8 family serine peptidase [Sphingomonas endophytica]|uniref:P/Homo B domain-containing protein n=1 Tax=Sphingomonas endophytica TaxID=869719 RepID=A0A147I2A2_9SPHN|nr:S8 family serine peptidase [Sphingomonas endophytica]KTT72040.1 hypothetical protein NS334_09735 [Sphingomonas endophytica]